MDEVATRWYVSLETGSASQHELISRACDLLAEESVPSWVADAAALYGADESRLGAVLTEHLHRAGLLPDSILLRRELHRRVVELAEGLPTRGVTEAEVIARRIEVLFQLSPSYSSGPLSIPIVEFPHFSVQTPKELFEYIMSHAGSILALRHGA